MEVQVLSFALISLGIFFGGFGFVFGLSPEFANCPPIASSLASIDRAARSDGLAYLAVVDACLWPTLN